MGWAKFVLAFVVLCLSTSISMAVPGHDPLPKDGCSRVSVHKEWRDLKKKEQLDYLRAVRCLMDTPPQEDREGVTSRFEEFQGTHILLTERVHLVGQFLPWHRHLGTLYWIALRKECGYRGPFAFWDWSRDADIDRPFNKSPIFHATTGFGGDGVPGTYTLPPDPKNESATNMGIYRGCVMDGPFKDIKAHRGPGKLITTHCIVRGIDDSWRPGVKTSNIASVVGNAKTYEEFRLRIDDLLFGHIHGSGHAIVGGEMLNIYSAGADPLFYLHHLNLDRVWWHWQNVNRKERFYQISGPSTQKGNDTITLDFVMDFPAVGRNITIREVMDIQTPSAGCFVFDY